MSSSMSNQYPQRNLLKRYALEHYMCKYEWSNDRNDDCLEKTTILAMEEKASDYHCHVGIYPACILDHRRCVLFWLI